MVSTHAKHPWWHRGGIYQIYIRSFCDSNGDGIGDIPGVISKLDYIASLGVEAIWLSPVTASANADWGYDVTDYRAIDPDLGTMEDFERLIKAAAKRKLRVITDFVPNHTSTQHPWFLNAKSSKKAKYRDYYIWAEPKAGRLRPNNWRSSFGGSAWTWHPHTSQYYLHNFLPQQADLNWRNPKVAAEFDSIMRFWLDKGVAGFRIDVFNMLIKDREFRDNPKSDKLDGLEVRLLGQKPLHNTSQPEIHAILRRWRRLADSYKQPRLLLGETTLVYDSAQLASFYGHNNELELAFNFKLLQAPFSAHSLRHIVEQTEAALGPMHWPVWTMSNHDQPRASERWAGGDERKLRLSMLMLLTLRGTPVLYYGDELGMPNSKVPRWAMKDPVGRKFWPFHPGRDRARTPMIWNHLRGKGFTHREVAPWLPFGPDERSVASQQAGDDTTLGFTQALMRLRTQLPELQTGDYRTLAGDQHIWVWQRGEGVVIAMNLGRRTRTVAAPRGTVRLATRRTREGGLVTGDIKLGPWEGVVIEASSS